MSKAEKFIQEHIKNCSNLVHLDDLNGNVWEENAPWLTPDQARRAVEIEKDEIYEWLINHNDYIIANGSITRFDMEKCVRDLKQAMKDETENQKESV